MAQVSVKLETKDIIAAAEAAGIDTEGQTPGRLAAEILRTVGGTRPASPIAEGGAALKRAGRRWEMDIAAYANKRGMAWDVAPLRGARDLLDLTGTLPGGWLVGAKSTVRGQSAAKKLYDAMDQSQRALDNLPRAARALGFATASTESVIPWQILQRPGAPTGRAYAVTEFDHMLAICEMRKQWDNKKGR